MNDLRTAIVAAARAFIDAPFVHQGRGNEGLDCVGLPICVARALGLVAPDFDVTGYPRQPDGLTLLHLCDRYMTRIYRPDMQPGDVIAIRFEQLPQHLGIVGDYRHGGLSMIHALGTPDGKGKVVEHHLNAPLMRRFVAAFRLPGVA